MMKRRYMYDMQLNGQKYCLLTDTTENTSTEMDVKTAMSEHSSVQSKIFPGLPTDWSNLETRNYTITHHHLI
jgi:hypothetical protein